MILGSIIERQSWPWPAWSYLVIYLLSGLWQLYQLLVEIPILSLQLHTLGPVVKRTGDIHLVGGMIPI